MRRSESPSSNGRARKLPILETDRLTLRRLQVTDQNEIFRLRSEIEVNRFIPRPPFHLPEEATDFIIKINEGVDKQQWLYWGIRLKTSQKILGTICLWNFNSADAIADVGYEMLPEYFGHGYMHEALQVVIEYATKQLKLQYLKAHTFSNNARSLRLLERNGFQLDLIPDKSMRLNEVVYKRSLL